MALTDTITQAKGMGANSSMILKQISSQNQGSPIVDSINKAISSGAHPDDVLNEIVKQNTPAPVSEPAPVSLPQTKDNVVSAIKKAGSDLSAVQQEQQDISDSNMNPIAKGFAMAAKGVQVAGTAAVEGIGGVAGALFKTLASHFLSPDQALAKQKELGHVAPDAQLPTLQIPSFIKNAAVDYGNNVNGGMDIVAQKINKWADANPNAGKILIEGLKTAKSAGDISSAILAADGTAKLGNEAPILGSDIKNVVPDIKAVPENITNKITEGLDNLKQTVADKINAIGAKNGTDLQKINEMISPKATINEVKLAQTQGRLYKGAPGSLFSAGTADQIATSDAQFKAVQTINKLIPDAGKLDEPTLFSTLDEKIGGVAKDLQPIMKKTPIKPETIDKINSDWQALKTDQMKDPYISSNVNLEKLQKNFEENFLKKSGSKNMDDLWKTAKAYDASVPANVKNATEISSDTLQNQRAIWLQNRGILRNAINDSVNGMGATSSGAFSDMHDMYEAQQSILSKAKISPAEEAKWIQWVKANPGKAKVIGIGVSAVGLDGVYHLIFK